MDTLIISKCERFTVHIKQIDVEGELWENVNTGKIYKKQSRAILSGFKHIKKQKLILSLTQRKKLLKTAKNRLKKAKFKSGRGVIKEN